MKITDKQDLKEAQTKLANIFRQKKSKEEASNFSLSLAIEITGFDFRKNGGECFFLSKYS